MDGSGTCCGLSLAPKRSYQLRLDPGSQLLWITFASAAVCLRAPAAAKPPPAVRQSAEKHPHNGAKRESCMGLSSPIQELFVNSQQDMPPISVIHPRYLPRLYRKQINCSNWGFDFMFCESAFHCALWRWLKTETHLNLQHIFVG